MPDPRPENIQAGRHVGDGQTESNEAVAFGDRRDEVRYEDDAAQLTHVRHTFPVAARPPEEHAAGAEPPDPLPPVTDVAEVKPAPSVWDARPTRS